MFFLFVEVNIEDTVMITWRAMPKDLHLDPPDERHRIGLDLYGACPAELNHPKAIIHEFNPYRERNLILSSFEVL